MWRYLKAAFLAGFDVPGIGKLPVNAMATAGFGILGFAEPSLWLLGLGLETTFLFALTTNRRFQKVVDAEQLESSELDAESKRRNLVKMLPPESQRRLLDLMQKCQTITDVARQSDDFLVEANRDALQRLEWVFIKLLVARHNLLTAEAGESEAELGSRIRNLQNEIAVATSDALRQSKAATLAIFRERLANVRRRQETLEEIDSDLTRIEAQAQLMLENTTMQGKPSAISADLELASNLASANLFGESGVAIADLDAAYGTGKPAKLADRSTEPS